MPRGKNSQNKTVNAEKVDNLKDEKDIQYMIAKDFIRACHGRISDPITRNLLNQGVLGVEMNDDGTPKKDSNNDITTKKISRATFYIWKKDAISLESIQQDFTDFVKIDYAVQIAGIKSMIQVLVNVMFTAIMAENDGMKKANLAHKLFTDLPLFTQFLDIEKRAIQHGKISLKDAKKNEKSTLATPD